MQGSGRVDQVSPQQAYEALRETPDSALVDVRTEAELAFVGIPDPGAIGRPLATVEWVDFPAKHPNEDFAEDLKAAFGGRLPGHLYFICRSGARSLAAAQFVAELAQREGATVNCVNVAEGFEGDLDAEGHRGTRNGWKVAGLPWRQS